MNKTFVILLVVLVFGASAWYVSQKGVGSKAGVIQAPEVTSENVDVAETGAKEFTIEGANFNFSVKEIKVNQGDTVQITFKNKDGFHDWVIDEFAAKTKQLTAGGEETVEFVADKAGTFEYYCSVGQHRQNGMVGKLIVE